MNLAFDNVADTLKGLKLPPCGKHPDTGEEFVKVTLEARQEMTIYHTLEPRPPLRQIAIAWAEDDDGYECEVEWRELTDEEWAEALVAYEKAKAEWRRTCGQFHSPGPRTYHASFETASGSRAEGVTGDNASEWIWLSASTATGATLNRFNAP